MKPPQYWENTITRYRLMEEYLVGKATEPARNYDLLSIVMLFLGGADGENYDGVLRMLDVLFSNETSEAEKRKIFQDDYDIKMTQTTESEVSVMCNLTPPLHPPHSASPVAHSYFSRGSRCRRR